MPALLVQKGISAICMHTNLDAAEGGVNDTLAAILGMRDTRPFADGCGRIGTVDETSAAALAAFCQKTLGPGVHYVEAGRPVRCLAEVSGAGGCYRQEAMALGADCLVTGEAATTTDRRQTLRFRAWWWRATGAPSTPSPRCWKTAWRGPFPA